MLAIDATRTKLAEAEFFHRKLVEVGRSTFSPEPEAFGFYLSAFVSAGRSVSLALQAEHKEKYDDWFPTWEASLTEDQRSLLKHFNTHRVATIHQRGIEVSHELPEVSSPEFFLAVAREGANVQIWHGLPGTPTPPFHRVVRTFVVGGTQTEVMAACGLYLEVVAKLVKAFTERYADAAA
jgi:hypothetical protein